MAITFDHVTKRIVVSSPQNRIDIQDLVNQIRTEEASDIGISDSQIAVASGKDTLDTGVAIGITLRLLSAWQIQWWPGNYTAKIGGGNILSDSGDAVAYVVGGPQVEITLSAAATIITSGSSSGLTQEEHEALLLIRDIEEGDWVLDAGAKQLILWAKDHTTELARFDLKDAAGVPSTESVYSRRSTG